MKKLTQKKVRKLVEMPPDLCARAEAFCKQSPQGYSMSALIRTALVEKIERENKRISGV